MLLLVMLCLAHKIPDRLCGRDAADVLKKLQAYPRLPN
jgi:hypothetical protein